MHRSIVKRVELHLSTSHVRLTLSDRPLAQFMRIEIFHIGCNRAVSCFRYRTEHKAIRGMCTRAGPNRESYQSFAGITFFLFPLLQSRFDADVASSHRIATFECVPFIVCGCSYGGDSEDFTTVLCERHKGKRKGAFWPAIFVYGGTRNN